jgi:hypothetical protein
MPIYATDPEAIQRWREKRRRQTVLYRAEKRRQQAEKPRDIKDTRFDRELDQAIERDRDEDRAS